MDVTVEKKVFINKIQSKKGIFFLPRKPCCVAVYFWINMKNTQRGSED